MSPETFITHVERAARVRATADIASRMASLFQLLDDRNMQTKTVAVSIIGRETPVAANLLRLVREELIRLLAESLAAEALDRIFAAVKAQEELE